MKQTLTDQFYFTALGKPNGFFICGIRAVITLCKPGIASTALRFILATAFDVTFHLEKSSTAAKP